MVDPNDMWTYRGFLYLSSRYPTRHWHDKIRLGANLDKMYADLELYLWNELVMLNDAGFFDFASRQLSKPNWDDLRIFTVKLKILVRQAPFLNEFQRVFANLKCYNKSSNPSQNILVDPNDIWTSPGFVYPSSWFPDPSLTSWNPS